MFILLGLFKILTYFNALYVYIKKILKNKEWPKYFHDLNLDRLFVEHEYAAQYEIIKTSKGNDTILHQEFYYNWTRDNKSSRVYKLTFMAFPFLKLSDIDECWARL